MARKSPEQYEDEIQYARARLPAAREQLRAIPGVVDVLVGIKETGGMATELVVFQVYVNEKRPLHALAPEHRIPPTIADVPTDVIANGPNEPVTILIGGMKLITSTGRIYGGTLGAIGLASEGNTFVPAETPLLLTNQHVAKHVGAIVGLDSLCDSMCCQCCDIGSIIDVRLTDEVDGAIGTLNPDVRFGREVLAIGAIRGSRPATNGMPIVKYGHRTGLTEGSVTQIDFSFTRSDKAEFINQIRVAPTAPYTKMDDRGDSGSVLLHADTHQVVGLIHATNEGVAIANHIAPVMDALHIDFPMDTSSFIPLTSAAPMADRPTMRETMIALRDDLARTETGQRWIALVRAHREELQYLVNHHRQTQVAWHRSHGPAFVAHYTKSARDPEYRVPREIGGMHVENTIVSMAAVLQRYGSQELAKAITDYYLTALELVQHSQSAQDLVSRARLIAGVDPVVEPQR
jgi:hypothetical protein